MEDDDRESYLAFGRGFGLRAVTLESGLSEDGPYVRYALRDSNDLQVEMPYDFTGAQVSALGLPDVLAGLQTLAVLVDVGFPWGEDAPKGSEKSARLVHEALGAFLGDQLFERFLNEVGLAPAMRQTFAPQAPSP